MNKIETNYLLENGITLQDWDRLLDLIGQSLYLKIGNNYNQVGLFFSTSYPTLWILPIIANIFAVINGLAAIVAIGYALVGIVLFLIATFVKK